MFRLFMVIIRFCPYQLRFPYKYRDLYSETFIGTDINDDGHEWPKHVVLILILIFKNVHPLYHTSCVIDYPPT